MGIALTPITLQYKKMQLLKLHTAKHSKDPDLRALYDLRKSRDLSKTRVTQELENIESAVEFDRKFTGQFGKFGLGYIKKKTISDPIAQHRKEITSMLTTLDEESGLVMVHDFAKQGKWISWDNGWNWI